MRKIGNGDECDVGSIARCQRQGERTTNAIADGHGCAISTLTPYLIPSHHNDGRPGRDRDMEKHIRSGQQSQDHNPTPAIAASNKTAAVDPTAATAETAATAVTQRAASTLTRSRRHLGVCVRHGCSGDWETGTNGCR